MATAMPPVTLDTPITIKVAIQGASRKFKIPLKDLGANVLLDKVSDVPPLRYRFSLEAGEPVAP